MRNLQDIAVRALRQLTKVYDTHREPVEVFMRRAMSLVRLYMEEGWHRCLERRGPLRIAALSNLMVTMRAIEARTLGGDMSMGIFWTFEEAMVRDIAMKVRRREEVALESLPSWREVSQHADLKIEAFSLRRMRISNEDIAMSQAEVTKLIELIGGELYEGCEVPGSSSSSELFEALMQV